MMAPRTLAPGQRAELWVADVTTGRRELVLESHDILVEAPNWTLDGECLVVNGDGRLWSVSLADPRLEPIAIDGVPDLNNDHVLAPDGERIFVSANDWHIYETRLSGGPARRVTGRSGIDGLMHFLHGVSPDGRGLAFVGLDPSGAAAKVRANVFTVDVTGNDYRQLTDSDHPADGPEYSPDGGWLYFNTEQLSGQAQLARIAVDGGPVERIRTSSQVDWFPHLSPDGRRAAFVAFPPGTQGHPPDVWVDLVAVATDDWQAGSTIDRIFGGQGSLNVNSWHPGSERLAYVAYPIERTA
jgi:Tol biopolymer transport system component